MADAPEIVEVLDAFLARVRDGMETHLTSLRAELLEHAGHREQAWRQALDERDRLEAERRQLEGQFANERRDLESRLADERLERQATIAALEAETREERAEVFGRLVRAMRSLDEATSLTAILDALAKGAVAEASRVAVLIVEPNGMRCWVQFGFAPDQGPFDVSGAPGGVLGTAVTSRQPARIAGGDTEAAVPLFMRPPGGHSGLIMPLSIGGETVAVLYAEGAERSSPEDDSGIWAEEVELLVRHAAARLESVTSERTVALLTQKG